MRLGAGSYECLGQVPIHGAPPELTGLPHPILTWGPCGHKWKASVVAAIEKSERERRRREDRERSDKAARRAGSIEMLLKADSFASIRAALVDYEGALPVDALRDAWRRLCANESPRPVEELVTVCGRQTVPGFFLSRGANISQWGRWSEEDRIPVFRAMNAGHEVLPKLGEGWETTYLGFDLWLDTQGVVWSAGRDGVHLKENYEPTRQAGGEEWGAGLSIGRGGYRARSHLVVKSGEFPTFRRSLRPSWGWRLEVPNARPAYEFEPSDLAYTRAIRALTPGLTLGDS